MTTGMRSSVPVTVDKKLLPGVRVAAVYVLAVPGLLGALNCSLSRPGVNRFGLIAQFMDHDLRDDLVDLSDQGGVIHQVVRGDFSGLRLHQSIASGVQHGVTDGSQV